MALQYENIGGMLVRRDGQLRYRCDKCGTHGESGVVLRRCPHCENPVRTIDFGSEQVISAAKSSVVNGRRVLLVYSNIIPNAGVELSLHLGAIFAGYSIYRFPSGKEAALNGFEHTPRSVLMVNRLSIYLGWRLDLSSNEVDIVSVVKLDEPELAQLIGRFRKDLGVKHGEADDQNLV